MERFLFRFDEAGEENKLKIMNTWLNKPIH